MELLNDMTMTVTALLPTQRPWYILTANLKHSRNTKEGKKKLAYSHMYHTYSHCVTSSQIFAYIYIYIYIYIYTYIHTYIHTYTHTYIHTHIYTHRYIHTHTHTYTHTHIHTHITSALYVRHIFAPNRNQPPEWRCIADLSRCYLRTKDSRASSHDGRFLWNANTWYAHV